MALELQQTVESYRKLRPQYEAFAKKLHDLVESLLRAWQVKFHVVESRTKTVESLTEKIQRPTKNYTAPLEQLPDLVGIRVILFYQDDVARVAAKIAQEFEIVESETSHQPTGYDPDHFGYLSLHSIVKVSKPRAALLEWGGFVGFKAEIQIRTVLQHGWATISHALQYKRESDVPTQLRRKLFRLAGLFELADEEFIELRDAESGIQRDIREAISEGRESIPVSRASVIEFAKAWPMLNTLRNIAQECGFQWGDPWSDDEDRDQETNDKQERIYGDIAAFAERLGIKGIDSLRESLSYDPSAFLRAIIKEVSGSWYAGDGFLILLMLIAAHPKHFTSSQLVESGWDKDVAEKVVRQAKKGGWDSIKLDAN